MLLYTNVLKCKQRKKKPEDGKASQKHKTRTAGLFHQTHPQTHIITVSTATHHKQTELWNRYKVFAPTNIIQLSSLYLAIKTTLQL